MERITYLITYQLRKPDMNYSLLYETIKQLGDWQHPLETTWVVRTNANVTTRNIFEKLHPVMDPDDSLFVVEITGQTYTGWLAKGFWTWLKEE
jgi:hypothetical protein